MNHTQVTRYHPLLVVLHWILAALIIAALGLGALKMAPMPNSAPMKLEALRAHMAGGIVIAVLMILRLLTRIFTTAPAAAATGSTGLDRLARLSHRGFYVLVLAMVGSGLFMALQTGVIGILAGKPAPVPADFWVFPVRTVHYLLSRTLIALIALHLAGVIYHSLALRDGLLTRMGFAARRSAVAQGVARLAPWFSRSVLFLASGILIAISVKFILHPVASATASHMTLGSPLAVTNMRASFGAFPLACAAITSLCLLSAQRRVTGLGFIAILIGVVLVVRIFGIVNDGTFAESRTVLLAESVLFALSVLGLFAERAKSGVGAVANLPSDSSTSGGPVGRRRSGL